MAAASSDVWLCRQLIAFITTIFILTHLQRHNVLVGARESLRIPSGDGSTLHASRANLEAAEDLGFDGAGSTRTWSTSKLGGSLKRRRVLTSRNSSVDPSIEEVEALSAFKAAITSDPLGTLRSWSANDSDACGWAGVVCSTEQNTSKRVVELNLGGGQLVGNLNSATKELSNLPFLQRLDLSANVLSGSIPASSLANCFNLSYFNISDNQVSGEIPSQLGELRKLRVIDFHSNNLTGEIPLSLGNCTLLRVLNLQTNLLVGGIPAVLGRLTSLDLLNLGSNSLSGTLPPALGNCSSLTSVSLSINSDLGGEIPLEWSQLRNLEDLDLSECNLEGTIPPWLGNLTSLSQLQLTGNQFRGGIPEVIGQHQPLTYYLLGGNNLTGVIPSSVTNCTSLTILSLARNQLTGEIPPLGLLSNLETLYLGTNNLTGSIPSSLANCSNLAELELGPNPLLDQTIPSWIGSFQNLNYLYLASINLQGGIPEEIGKLSNLETLIIYANNLSGTIPTSLANCTFMGDLELSNNQLVGEIPPEIGLLQQLTWLNLDNNLFTGPFPAFVANLSQIICVTLGGNFLSGELDSDFGGLSQMQIFSAYGNQFTGPLPETLSNCSLLFYISLSSNNFSGEIPPSLGNISALEQIFLSANELTGVIPVGLVTNSNLGVLDLQENNLEGSIPPDVGGSFSLTAMALNQNNFSGTIPSTLGNCSNLISLDLSYNRFTGNLPGEAFSGMVTLTTLNLSNNLFSGPWPLQLSTLASIQIIDVSVNNLSGALPATLGLGCPALIRLDVSLNNLSGEIPPELGSLKALDFFNASYNNFQGPVPDSGFFHSNLTGASFLGNPGLCGSSTILGPGHEEECAATPTPSNATTSHNSCNSFKCKKIWIPTLCAALAFVLLFVGVLSWATTLYRTRRNNNHRLLIKNFASYRRFSRSDVLRFISEDGDNVIGKGAKSVVYKGVLPGGEVFAVKILPPYPGGEEDADDGRRRDRELLKEVHTLAKLRHRNILKVLSFFSSLEVKAIILEYMPEGSLHGHLHDGNQVCRLPWETRLKIAERVAEAMTYLHHDFPQPLIHRDLKPSNILLDANLDPKVGDFGLSKFANPNRDGEATMSTFCGTIGYMPPEYAMGTSVSTKGDVYSYGMVLLEMLTGRQPGSGDNFAQSEDLRGWVVDLFEERPLELLDSTLAQEGAENSQAKDQMMLLMRVALFCTREAPQSRPSMSDVLAMLRQIKELGSAHVTPRRMEDLANDGTSWASQDPSEGSTSPPSSAF